MTSPNISFNQIPNSIRKPGRYFEFNNSLAVRTLPSAAQRILVIAQRLTTAPAPVNTVVQIFDAETAALQFGRGSQCHRMVVDILQTNPYARLFVCPITDAAGAVAATATITITGTATAAGSVDLNLAGVAVQVAVASADTATSIAAAIVAAVTARPDLPFTAANAAGVVTLTARNQGTVGNALRVSATANATGITAAATAFAGGLSDPDITAALAAVQSGGHEIIVVPYQASGPLQILRTHLNFVSGPMEQRSALGVFALTSTLATATTLSAALNSERLTGAVLPASFTPAEEVAAAYAAVIAAEEDPARPLNTLVLTSVQPPAIASRLTRTEQETALANGITPLEVQPGEQVGVVRAITTYTLNALGVTDISYLDLTTVRTLDFVRRAVRERVTLRFPRDKLSERTAARVRSEVLDVLLKLQELEIVEAVQANQPALVVERATVDPNRLNVRIPVDVVNGLHVLAGRIDLLL